jgi:aminoglycoside phosphotransferase (APT) family kinase protein
VTSIHATFAISIGSPGNNICMTSCGDITSTGKHRSLSHTANSGNTRGVHEADIRSLEEWLHGHGIAHGRVSSIQLLSGGTQNLLYRFEVAGEGFVLRRPALKAREGADETIRREARVLAALGATAVPHARFRGFCDDVAVVGAPFLLTDAVDGYNACVEMPPAALADPAVRHRMGLAMVDGIAALAGVDHVAVGLADFGKLDTFIERQAQRWRRQFYGYSNLSGWPGPASLPGIDRLSIWLDAHRPPVWRAGLMHGDYHIANVLFTDAGELAAMLDWELAALGDPLLDLGRLLAAWPDPDGSGPLSLKVEPWSGFPNRDALIERYAAQTGRDLADLLWFEVLACYKLGIILEGTYARACAGLAAPEVGERLHRGATALVHRALSSLDSRG